jgi:hypothetical protein
MCLLGAILIDDGKQSGHWDHAATRLATSSAGRVRSLHVENSTLSSIPEDMQALHHLNLSSCCDLSGDWLPASSASLMWF